MKILRPLFAVALYLVIGGFAPRPFLGVTYYYVSNTEFQRLEPGHTTELDLKERTIDQSFFKYTGNWTTSQQSFTATNDYEKYIGSIAFAEESTADGGSDGQITLQEALDAIWASYTNNHPDQMFSTITVDVFTVVYINAADAAH